MFHATINVSVHSSIMNKSKEQSCKTAVRQATNKTERKQ